MVNTIIREASKNRHVFFLCCEKLMKAVQALKKCIRWIKGQPSIVGGVIVNTEEAKAHRAPSSNYIPPMQEDFEAKVAGSQVLGASITVKDHESFRETVHVRWRS